MVKAGKRMDPDLNKFDSFHVVMDHPLMTEREWFAAYNEAWQDFYTFDNLRTILMRIGKTQYWGLFKNIMWYKNSLLEPRHPMVAGFVRTKNRKDVRPGIRVPGFWEFHIRRASELSHGFRKRITLFHELQELWLLTRKPEDPTFRFVADFNAAVNETKHRLSSLDISIPYAKWREEMNAAVLALREKLTTQFDPSVLSGKARKRAHAVIEDMNAYLEKINPGEHYQRGVSSIISYLTKNRETIENCSLKWVGRRRRITDYWRLSLDRVRKGKIFRFLLSFPKLVVNGLHDIRMSIHFAYHLMNKNFIRHK
jgi:hypothetical protein